MTNPAGSKPLSLDVLLKTAQDALLAGGKILRKGFDQRRRVFYKTRTSPVTHVDIMSERAVIDLIRRRHPTHRFLAEESSYLKEITAADRARLARGLGRSTRTVADGLSTYRWIIDPLDGTVNYLHGFPQSSVSVAVESGGVLLAGGVYDPFRDELFLARRGGGATLNGKRIRVSPEKELGRSLLVTGFPYDHQERADFYLSFVKPFLKKAMDLRRLGSAALDLAWVACGRVDGYWEFNLNSWDVAAGWLLVAEAGGRVSDFRGSAPDLEHPAETLATNSRIHEAMRREFRKTFSRLASTPKTNRKNRNR